MPIKPENRGRYPTDWPAIRARILARAENRCEWCKAPNGERIARGVLDGVPVYVTNIEQELYGAIFEAMLAATPSPTSGGTDV